MVRTAADILADLALAGEPEPEPKRPLQGVQPRKGCPSASQYRRHLKAREDCQACRELASRKERERRQRRKERAR